MWDPGFASSRGSPTSVAAMPSFPNAVAQTTSASATKMATRDAIAYIYTGRAARVPASPVILSADAKRHRLDRRRRRRDPLLVGRRARDLSRLSRQRVGLSRVRRQAALREAVPGG